MRLLPATLATLLLPVLLDGQAATFVTYGTACASSAGGSCVSTNWTSPFGGNRGLSSSFALLFNTGAKARLVCGVELQCKTSSGRESPMAVAIYDRATTGRPGKSLVSGTMQVGGFVRTWTVRFAQPVLLSSNTDHFVVFNNRANINMPIMTSGKKTTHYWNGPISWKGPSNTYPWSYRVLCCGLGVAPVLSATGAPKIGKTFSLVLSKAKASTSGLMLIGVKKIKAELGPAGAPGCTLLTDPVVITGLRTYGAGTASMLIKVPNSKALIGFKFYVQFAVADTTANPMKFVFSNGGEGRAGT